MIKCVYKLKRIDRLEKGWSILFCCKFMKDTVYSGRSFGAAGMKKLLFISILSIAFFISYEIQSALAQNVTLGIPNPSSITFNDADPDLQPLLSSTPNSVSLDIKISGNPGSPWKLTHLAAGDLSPSIPISNISWTVTPQPPFVNGSMNKTVAQTAAQGVGNVNQTGTFTFRITNLWTYNTGNFSVVTTFTLSAP